MDWKETVTSMSDKVFPGLSHKIDENLNVEYEVLSNLPLQMALYFNVLFSPIWLCIIVIFLKDNYSCYNELYKFIIIAVMVSILIIELIRLYLGYEGNLRDKIPELAGFWMLSLLLQFPLQGFLLLNPHFNMYVVDVVAQSVMFLLLCWQLISGYFALKYTATQQATYFRIMKLRSNVTLSNKENRYKVK